MKLESRRTQVNSQDSALLKKDLEMQKLLAKNAQKDLDAKDQQINDIRISSQNEAKHLKAKLQRDFENQLDDEKAATQMQIDEM